MCVARSAIVTPSRLIPRPGSCWVRPIRGAAARPWDTSYMRRGVSTHMFIRQRLGSAILDRVAHAGFRLVEIFCARQHMDYRSRNQILDLASWFASNEMKLHSMHMPMYSA